MKKTTLLTNNIVPIIVAIITSITSIIVSHIQIQKSKPENSIGEEKVRAIVNEQIDLKLAPLNVKIEFMLSDIREFKDNQVKVNDILKWWIGTISSPKRSSKNTGLLPDASSIEDVPPFVREQLDRIENSNQKIKRGVR